MAKDDYDEREEEDLISLKKHDVLVIVGSLVVGIIIGYFLKKIFDKHGYHNLPPGTMYAPPWHGACTKKHVEDITPGKDYIDNVPSYNKSNMIPMPEGNGTVDASTGDIYFKDPTVWERHVVKRDPKTGRIIGIYKETSEYGYDVI